MGDSYKARWPILIVGIVPWFLVALFMWIEVTSAPTRNDWRTGMALVIFSSLAGASTTLATISWLVIRDHRG